MGADEAVYVFQLIVVESQRSQVSQVLQRVLIDVVGLVVSDVEDVQVGVVCENIAGNCCQLVPCQPETVQAGQGFQLTSIDHLDSVLAKVEGPQPCEGGHIIGHLAKLVVVQGQVLQVGRACEEASWQGGQLVVVEGEGGEGGEGDQGGGWQGGELVVGEKEDVQVEEGGEGALLDLGELVVLQVEDLQALLPVEQLAVQLGQGVVAQVEGHQLRQRVENLQQCDRIDKST